MIKLCIAGATGRMGSTLIKDAYSKGHKIVGAIAASTDPKIGKTLRELGLCNSNVKIIPPTNLIGAAKDADIYMSFTTPKAEVYNIPQIAKMGKKIIMGTTGLTKTQMDKICTAVTGKVPAVFAPNFALGVNLLFKIISICNDLPTDYHFSIVEAHHIGKKDAPSGTAKELTRKISKMRGYNKIVYGREGFSPRAPNEVEVCSIRGGGVPGIHEVIITGPYEMIKIEHSTFSRSVFTQGALFAAEWLMRQRDPKVYTMNDVLI